MLGPFLGLIYEKFVDDFWTALGSLLGFLSGPGSALGMPTWLPESHQELQSSEEVPFQKPQKTIVLFKGSGVQRPPKTTSL